LPGTEKQIDCSDDDCEISDTLIPPRCSAANDRQRRLELEWKDVDVGPWCRSKLSEQMQAGEMRL
jgi:hypothetical protein